MNLFSRREWGARAGLRFVIPLLLSLGLPVQLQPPGASFGVLQGQESGLVVPTYETLAIDGVRVFLRQEARTPAFELSLQARVPLGMPAVTEKMLLLSAMLRTRADSASAGGDLTALLQRTGWEYRLNVGPELLNLELSGNGETLEEALRFAGDVIGRPLTDAVALDRARTLLLGLKRLRTADALTQATDQLHEEVFGNHPYAARLDSDAIQHLTIADLEAARAALFTREETLVTVVSPAPQSVLKPLLTEALKPLGQSARAVGNAPRASSMTLSTRRATSAAGSAMVMGRSVLPESEVDFVALEILARALNEAVIREAREQGGARAGVRWQVFSKAGILWGWTTQPGPSTSERSLLNVLARAGQGRLTSEEIQRGRTLVEKENQEFTESLGGMISRMGQDTLLELNPQTRFRRLALARTLPEAEVARMGTVIFSSVLSPASVGSGEATAATLPTVLGAGASGPVAAAPGAALQPVPPESQVQKPLKPNKKRVYRRRRARKPTKTP